MSDKPTTKEMLEELDFWRDELLIDTPKIQAIRALIEEHERLEKIIKAKDRLLAAYRLGDRKMADKALNELEDIRDSGEE